MKTFFQVFVKIMLILLVAGIVIAAAYVVVQSGAVSLSGPGGVEGGIKPERQSNEGLRPNPEMGASDFERHDRGEFSLGRGLAGVAGSSMKITIITLVILGLQKLLTLWKTKKVSAVNSSAG